MKIVIGHKNLNLEELFSIAYLPSQNEVVVDNVISHEFNPQPPQVQNKEMQAFPELMPGFTLRDDHVRAVLLTKLVQLIKLKKNVSKQTINYFVTILNENRSFTQVTYSILKFIHMFIGRKQEPI